MTMSNRLQIREVNPDIDELLNQPQQELPADFLYEKDKQEK